LEFFLFGLPEAGFEFAQGRNDGGGLVVADLLEQGGHPLSGLGRAFAVEVVGDRPEMFVGVMILEF
jgi:hypothetical protein